MVRNFPDRPPLLTETNYKMNEVAQSEMNCIRKKPRAATASHHKYADCAAMTLLFGNEHVLLHLSMYVVLPLPYLCKACAQQEGSSFTSAHIYALSRHKFHVSWMSCRFSASSVFVLQLVKRQPDALRLASTALKDDCEIVLEAVKQDGHALRYASAALQDDREIVLEAIKQDEHALSYASAALKNDREIMLWAVKQNGAALRFASAALKNDREIVLGAVRQDGYALRYAAAALKDDREIVLEGAKQNGFALQWADGPLASQLHGRTTAGSS